MRNARSNLLRPVVLTAMALASASTAQFWPNAELTATPELTGVWDVTLHVEMQHGTEANRIRGSLALIPGTLLPTSEWPGLTNPSHVGTYSIDVERLGVVPVRRRDIRIAGAVADSPDRVRIVLNPGVDHGALVMSGAAGGDSIVGTWRVTAYALGTSGRFHMRRAGTARADGPATAHRPNVDE